MKVFTQKELLISALNDFRRTQSGTVGFVPTMGALHTGHTSLVERALKENELVVVSIFVNPTQFNNAQDLKKYPRNESKDLEVLNAYKKNVWVYLPDTADLYEEKVEARHYDFGSLEEEMEGKFRKGHFDGVGTVVSKLFQIVEPDRAYFGEKDFQQLQIIRKLVEIENFNIEIIGCPIIREENGLAMSSRNQRLTARQLEEAGFIYHTLNEVKKNFENLSIEELNKMVVERFLSKPNMQLEYFLIADEETLIIQQEKDNSKKYRAFIAVEVEEVRLIDNLALN